MLYTYKYQSRLKAVRVELHRRDGTLLVWRVSVKAPCGVPRRSEDVCLGRRMVAEGILKWCR